MEETLVKTFLTKETIFAVLFIWLFVKQIKQSEERENKLYDFLDGMKIEFANLVKHYERLSIDVEDIKAHMESRKKKIKDLDEGGN